MGRFDKKVNKNEPNIKVKKRKLVPNFKDHASETTRNMGII
jgi:hypothetical protein